MTDQFIYDPVSAVPQGQYGQNIEDFITWVSNQTGDSLDKSAKRVIIMAAPTTRYPVTL
jgi:hypothetical protein